MDRILSFLLLAWLVVMAVGIVIALLPVLAFLVGFIGMILVVTFLARLISSWLFF